MSPCSHFPPSGRRHLPPYRSPTAAHISPVAAGRNPTDITLPAGLPPCSPCVLCIARSRPARPSRAAGPDRRPRVTRGQGRRRPRPRPPSSRGRPRARPRPGPLKLTGPGRPGRARSRLRKSVARGMSSAWNHHLGGGRLFGRILKAARRVGREMASANALAGIRSLRRPP